MTQREPISRTRSEGRVVSVSDRISLLNRFRVIPAMMFLCLLVYALLGLFFVFYGRIPNEDGSYLYAAKLAYRGKIPGVDFFNSYMYFWTYVYGLVQVLFGEGLLAARLFSVVLSVGMLFLSMRIAQTLVNDLAGLIVGLLIVSRIGLSDGLVRSTSETLALFLALASLYILLGPFRHPYRKNASAVCLACLCVATRIIFLPLLLLELAYITIINWKQKHYVLTGVVSALVTLAIVLGPFAVMDWEIFVFNLAIFRRPRPWVELPWYDPTWSLWQPEILYDYVVGFIHQFSSAIVFGGVVVIYLLRFKLKSASLRLYLRIENAKKYGLLLALIFSIGFLHLLPKPTWPGYQDLLFPVIAILLGCGLARIFDELSSAKSKTVFLSFIALTIGVALVNPGILELARYAVRPTLHTIQPIADLIRANTEDDDKILTDYMPFAIESRRDVLEGMTRGYQSLSQYPSDYAQKVCRSNVALLGEALRNKEPKAVILTNTAELWKMYPGWEEQVERPFRENYYLAQTLSFFAGEVKVYLPKK